MIPTDELIFFRGVGQPPTSLVNYHLPHLKWPYFMGFLLRSQIHTLPIFLPGSPTPGGPSGPWCRQHAALFGLLRLVEIEPAPWAKCIRFCADQRGEAPKKTPPKNRPKKAGHIHQSLAYFKHILATLSHDPLEGDPQRIHRGWLGRRVHSAMGPWSSLQGSLGDFETPMAGQSHHLEANC